MKKKDHKTALMAILVHLSILIAYKFVAVVVVLGFCTLLYLLFLSSRRRGLHSSSQYSKRNYLTALLGMNTVNCSSINVVHLNWKKKKLWKNDNVFKP